ncbi:tRNA (guanosine(37)-N1)-methyltransferase TrmD [Niameybacter massiliensis]|uniref:tRNA (guanosine(37)-N1)-methyltransferase TrmD n=1 Tax=Niameybacter massiliensis TaxID=1658108 RepID=UPI0006B66A47|nr:tRNA (guanosine(37)-N1)-methyltransferase TrmD [Niameybacter massiliensis]
MKITIMTLFPEMIENAVNCSILGRARQNGLIEIEAINIRDFANNKHLQVDDYPYGGGAGMLMMADPVCRCYDHIVEHSSVAPQHVLYMSPQGKPWKQQMAEALSSEEHIVLLCGHYEGIDQRALDAIVTEEVSIGDYVLTGGELAALVVADSISRLVPGVLGKAESFQDESFSDGLLEYPHYTRPAVYRDEAVPDVLLSGNHQKIAAYRREMSLINTFNKRPDLLKRAKLTEKEKCFINEYAKKRCKS